MGKVYTAIAVIAASALCAHLSGCSDNSNIVAVKKDKSEIERKLIEKGDQALQDERDAANINAIKEKLGINHVDSLRSIRGKYGTIATDTSAQDMAETRAFEQKMRSAMQEATEWQGKADAGIVKSRAIQDSEMVRAYAEIERQRRLMQSLP